MDSESTGDRPTTGGLRFRLLGPVQASVGGQALALGPARHRLLLALLLLSPRPVSTGQLVSRIWGERPPRAARSAVYGHLARLRAVLSTPYANGHKVLVRCAEGYRVVHEPEALDLTRFRQLVHAPAAGPAASAQALSAALALWPGEVCAGLSSPWLDEVRERLAEERVNAQVRRIAALLDLGRAGQVLPELHDLAAARPTDESVAGQLMLALYRVGRQADALGWFDRVRQRLARDIGVDPGPALRELHAQILRGDRGLLAETPTAAAVAQPGQPAGQAAPPVGQAAQPAGPAAQPGWPAGQAGAGRPGDVPDSHAARSARPAPTAGPAQLPHLASGFTGRSEPLAALSAWAGSRPSEAGAVCAVTGPAGVGKTALAVHWARSVRAEFPDGQLYVDLHGFSPQAQPMAAEEALGRLLRTLGTPPSGIPVTRDEQAALYRSLVAERRVLVLLDNAASAEQVRPLLPGSPSCLTLVTSRVRLSGLVALDGAYDVPLSGLDLDESLALLRVMLGADTVDTASASARALVGLCDHLPLALRVAAAMIADRSLADLPAAVRALRRGGPLRALMCPGDESSGVAASFDASYHRLGEGERRLFRRLSLAPGPDFTVPAAAVLVDEPEDQVSARLELLAAAHLVERHAPGRFRQHDLLREYAGRRCLTDDEPDQRAADRERLLRWYRASAHAAATTAGLDLLRPPHRAANRPCPQPYRHADGRAALEWVDAERSNLLAAIESAATEGPQWISWQLADVLRGFLRLRPQIGGWLRAAEAAQRAAHDRGEIAEEAAMHLSLADARHLLGQDGTAAQHDREALALSQRGGWLEGEASALAGLGRTRWGQGRLTEAADHLTAALERYRRLGHREGEATTLGSLARALHDSGDVAGAVRCCHESLDLSRRARARFGEALNLYYLGIVGWDRGDLDESRVRLADALALSERAAFRQGRSLAGSALAAVLAEAGDVGPAAEHVRRAQQLIGVNGDRRIDSECLNAIAAALTHLDDVPAALRTAARSVRLSTQIGYRRGEVYARLRLGQARSADGDLRGVVDEITHLLVLCRAGGYELITADAARLLGETHDRLGDADRAAHFTEAALRSYERTGRTRRGERAARRPPGPRDR